MSQQPPEGGQPPGDGQQPPYGPGPQGPAGGGPGYPAAPGYGYPPEGGTPYGTPPAASPAPGPAKVYPKNDLGIWSLVLGLASIVLSCSILTGVPAIVIGNAARRAVRAGDADNDGMAVAGVILGWVSVGLFVLAVLGFVILLAVGGGIGMLHEWSGSDVYSSAVTALAGRVV